MGELEDPCIQESPLNKITSEGHLEEDTVVVVRSNGSLKRKNVSFDVFNYMFRLNSKIHTLAF
jgi:hypothetical protein